MSAFRKVDHHVLRNFVPYVRRVCIREFRTISSPIQALEMTIVSSHESSSTLSDSESIRNTFFFVSSFFSNQCHSTLT